MKNKFEIWKIIDSDIKDVIINDISYANGKLHIIALINGKKVEINFDKVSAYHITDEGFLLKGWSAFNNPKIRCFGVSKNSDYLQWFHEESCNIFTDNRLFHFSIRTDNECIDVITHLKPSTKFVD